MRAKRTPARLSAPCRRGGQRRSRPPFAVDGAAALGSRLTQTASRRHLDFHDCAVACTHFRKAGGQRRAFHRVESSSTKRSCARYAYTCHNCSKTRLLSLKNYIPSERPTWKLTTVRERFPHAPPVGALESKEVLVQHRTLPPSAFVAACALRDLAARSKATIHFRAFVWRGCLGGGIHCTKQ